MSFKVNNGANELIMDCDNCGSEDHIYSNASGDVWCENCGWQAEED